MEQCLQNDERKQNCQARILHPMKSHQSNNQSIRTFVDPSKLKESFSIRSSLKKYEKKFLRLRKLSQIKG